MSLFASGGAAMAELDAIWSKIDQMTLREKVGQMFVPYVYGASADTTAPADVGANRALYGVDDAEQLIEKYRAGGIIYFAWSNNVNNPRQISGLSNGLQRAAMDQPSGVPLLISADQEQGVVVRVDEPGTQFPGAMALGATRNTESARKAAAITGRELRASGINQNFAPVVDVNVNAQNPVIGVRSFGSNPSLVANMVGAQVRGFQQGANISATAKHFPGHGDTVVDSHYGLPVITHNRSKLKRTDLLPFRAAIGSDVDAIMSAHIVVPALDDSGRPATLSRPILTGLLRDEMGYDGLILTDSLSMEGVRQQFGDDRVPIEAIRAGADVMLMPPNMDLAYGSILEAVRGGKISERRINESVYRILEVKQKRGLFENPYVNEDAADSTVGTPQNRAAASAIADKTVTLVKNEAGTLPLAPNIGQNVLVTGAGGVPGSPADTTDRSTLGSLAYQMRERGTTTAGFDTGSSPNDATIAEAKTRGGHSDLIVVTTNKASISPGQQALVKALLGTGKPVVLVATRDPYDIAYFTQAPTYLATYSYRAVSMGSLARVLFGEVNPSGKLPVRIPATGNPGSTLYPYGHGLGYGG